MLHAWTRRLKGQTANSSQAETAWAWNRSGASRISAGSGSKAKIPRNQGLTVSRYW